MENKTDSTVVKSANGKKLDTPLEYSWAWVAYQTVAELETAKDTMTLEEQLKFRNDQREAKARGKSYQKVLADNGIVKPTAENDDQVRLKDMVKTLMTSGLYTEAAARELAASVLKIQWAD